MSTPNQPYLGAYWDEVSCDPDLGPHIRVGALALGPDINRRDVIAWCLKPTQRKLAQRLCQAILAHKAVVPGTIKTDALGKTYLDCKVNVMGRTLNADLTRLGF